MTVHFVVPRESAEKVERLGGCVVGRDYPYWLGGQFNWTAQAWLVLRESREGLTIGVEPKPGVVNVAHTMVWRRLGARYGEFRLSVRADYRRLYDVDFEILQNPSVRLSRYQAYLPYWPVPGLIPRDVSRRRVETLAYAGRIGQRNLAGPLRDGHERHPALDGLEFVVVPSERWHDMSRIDLLVAIRSFDRVPHVTKPPSKLFNAWIAGIPLIAGWDSAFSAIGRPGIDYVRVDSEGAFHQAVAKLREDPGYYASIVSEGWRRAPEVSHDAIAQEWLRVLDGPVRAAFDEWKASGGATRRRWVSRSIDIGRGTLSRLKRHVKGRGGR